MGEDRKKDRYREVLEKVNRKIRITKVVATRSVKGPGGDNFLGFSAAWDSVQDDSMQGLGEDVDSEAKETSGLTMGESQVAALMLGMHTDIAAYRNALASGTVSVSYAQDAINAAKSNYSALIEEVISSIFGENR